MKLRLVSALSRCLPLLVACAAIPVSGQVVVPVPFVPNDPYLLPNVSIGFPGQWYLVNRAPSTLTYTYQLGGQTVTVNATNVGLDANLTAAWQRGLTGKGVVIGIVGITGLQGDHPDLVANYRADLSKQFSQDPALRNLPQGPVLSTDNHDTAVAGIAAARGGNGIGMTGAAPFAGIAGFRVDNPDNTVNPASNQNYVDANYFASGVTSSGQITGYAEVSVRNRSYARTQPFTVEDPRVIQSLNDTANNNVVNVFAAGNFRGSPIGDTGVMQGNSLASAIAVAALGSDGKFADYSNYGASVFVTAPGARLDNTGFLAPSVDRTGLNGYDPGSSAGVGDPFPDNNYTSIFNGTSGTAPIVSGIVALGKELNPFLDVRWARHALAVTSRMVDPTDASSTGGWQTNGAGLKFNPNYGFGLVDAGAFVNKIEQIAYITAPQTYTTGTVSLALANRTLSSTAKLQSITVNAGSFTAAGVNKAPLESVEVTLDITSANRDALQGTLVSPAGTTSTFMTASNSLTGYLSILADPTPAAGLQWTYVANNFWGEDPFGTWKLSIADLANNSSSWNTYALTLHLGQMVLESANLAVTTNTTAHSVVLDSAATAMSIASGTTFSVRDEFWVNNGSLRVDGRLQDYTAAGLARSRLKLNGGQLTGNGTIAMKLGVVNSAGTVRPGDAAVVGALTIEGNYTQETAGVLEIDLASNSQADALVVKGGDVALGGTLRLKLLPGATIVAGPISPIIRADATNRINGAFQTIEGLRIAPTLAMRRAASAANIYSLEAYRDYLVADVSAYFTTADRELAVYLNQLSGLSGQPAKPYENLLRAIDQQTSAANAAAAIDAIGPFSPGVAPTLALAGDSARIDTVLRRARADRPDVHAPPHDWYVEASYAAGNMNATSRRPAFTYFDRGLLAGVDARLSPQVFAGAFVGASASRSGLDRTNSKLDGNHRAIGGELTWAYGATYTTVVGEYGSTSFRRVRNVTFTGTNEQIRSDSDAHQWSGALEVGHLFSYEAWRHRIFGNVRWQQAAIDGYTEPGSFGWTVAEQRSRSNVGQLGYEVAYAAKLDRATLQPFASIAFAREFENNDHTLTAWLNGDTSTGLQVHTERADRDYAHIEAGLSLLLKNDGRVYVAGSNDVGQADASRKAVHIGASWPF